MNNPEDEDTSTSRNVNPRKRLVHDAFHKTRGHAAGAFPIAVTVVGVIAGLLSASGTTWPLLAYLGLLAVTMVAILAYITHSRPRHRYSLAAMFNVRHATLNSEGAHTLGHLSSRAGSLPLAAVDFACPPHPQYHGGFHSMLSNEAPTIAIVASSPREVPPSRRKELCYPIFSESPNHELVVLDQRQHNWPQRISFSRQFPGGADQADFPLSVKDVVFLPELAYSLGLEGSPHQHDLPFIWPEHCVDVDLASCCNLIIVGAGDTNFWHAALFETSWKRDATRHVPFGLWMRQAHEDGGSYGSDRICARLEGLEGTLPRRQREHPGYASPDGSVTLHELDFPTAAMIQMTANPLAPPGSDLWCVHVAGLRSLGTAGGVLALSQMIRSMKADGETTFASRVPTSEADVDCLTSAVVSRTTAAQVARLSSSASGRHPREIPFLGNDPGYSDTYMPTGVEIFTNWPAGEASWTSIS